MPRRRVVAKRDILPDPKFHNQTVAKFINHVMVSGKKAVAERIVYGAFDRIVERDGSTDPVEVFENALDAIAALRDLGFAIAAIEQTASSTSLLDWRPEPGSRWAFVFGNEVRGVESETVDACDVALEIPQFGVKQSLNVSVCGGIVLWDAAQKIGLPG